jgi:hypothetical protein
MAGQECHGATAAELRSLLTIGMLIRKSPTGFGSTVST